MQITRWHWLGISLVALGVLTSWVSLIAGGRPWGVTEWGVLLGSAVALAGLFWFRRWASEAVDDLEARESALGALSAELKSQADALDRRQRELVRKLAVWHEWMEFPEPVDLSVPTNELARLEQHAAVGRLSEQDRRLNELLEQESKLLFENILANKYAIDGQFQPTVLRDDAYVLIRKVARIYRPDVEHPLIETSLEQLARAASRACLHFLVVLETLPVDVREYNIKSMYGWIKQGVKAYGVYRSAKPYMPYVNSAFYLTRFALGANPISLMAWWAASEVASRTASSVARRFVEQRSLALLHDVVRVIGFEVAGLYGGHVRWRDPNWVYGVELTELLSLFPLSRDVLAHALQEVGSIQLLNEYDRIFLYRCLAAHKSAGPARCTGVDFLSGPQCHAIAKRLERFFALHMHGKTSQRVNAWRDQAERRLGVKLKLDVDSPALSATEQANESVLSLISFLSVIKQLEGAHWDRWLRTCEMFSRIAYDDYESLLDERNSEPPPFFAEPNLDPDGEFAEVYLRDLVHLAVNCPPHDMPVEPLLQEVGAFLRRDEVQIRKLLDNAFVGAFHQRCANVSSPPSVPSRVARAALWLMEAGEKVQFVYEGASRHPTNAHEPQGGDEHDRTQNAAKISRKRDWWLLGTDQRLMVVSPDSIPCIVWLGGADVQSQPDTGRFVGGCLLIGGTWVDGSANPDAPIHLRGQPLRRYESYFAPLLEYAKK